MAGALSVVIVEFSGARTISLSLVGDPISWPSAKTVDRRPIAGRILFDVGWGLTGMCPGASLVGLGLGYQPSALFVVSLIFWIGELLERVCPKHLPFLEEIREGRAVIGMSAEMRC